MTLQVGTAAYDLMAALRRGDGAVWFRNPARPNVDRAPLRAEELKEARDRLARFVPVLRRLFPSHGWDGVIRSGLLSLPADGRRPALLVKADHDLPMTGSVKARGGVYELLCLIEGWAAAAGVVTEGGPLEALAGAAGPAMLADRRVAVASTGNLGFSVGLVARAFGIAADIHMSHDAKAWKKARLRAIGATVIEHAADYSRTVALARDAAAATGAAFIDDENSRSLFVGYATAAEELASQLQARGLTPTAAAPLVTYLPCGVGGAPGGVTAGLKARYGDAVRCVFVEPVASACVLAAMACGGGEPVSVYDLGLDNRTIADGLAVPRASALVLDAVRGEIDAVVALPDQGMLAWVARAWTVHGLKLEPSAAAALAAVEPFLAAAAARGEPLPAGAVHVAWTTGGSLLPADEFDALLKMASDPRPRPAEGGV
jgi:D-serine dehydratase